MNYSGGLRVMLLLGSLCCVALLPHANASHTPLELTPQEHAWIEAHPILRVAALDNLMPIEYAML